MITNATWTSRVARLQCGIAYGIAMDATAMIATSAFAGAYAFDAKTN